MPYTPDTSPLLWHSLPGRDLPTPATTSPVTTTRNLPPAASSFRELKEQIRLLTCPMSTPGAWIPSPEQVTQIAHRTDSFPQAGSTNKFAAHYADAYGASSAIYKQVLNGAQLHLTEPIKDLPNGKPMPVSLNPEKAARFRQVIHQMISMGIARPITQADIDRAGRQPMLHSLFWRDKKEMPAEAPYGGSMAQAEQACDQPAIDRLLKYLRLIINLKPGLNKYGVKQPFRQNGISQATMMIRRCDWMIYLDVRSAFYNLLMYWIYQILIAFKILDPILLAMYGQHGIMLLVPCFGLWDAPRLFRNTLRPALELPASYGVRLNDIVDDVLCAAAHLLDAPDGAQALRHGAAIAISMEFHGWPISVDKSATIPTQVVVYGGGLLDSRYLWGQMPEKKRIAQNRRLKLLALAIISRGFYTSRREIATGCMMCRSNQMWVYGAAVHMMYTTHLLVLLSNSTPDWDYMTNEPATAIRDTLREWAYWTSTKFNFWIGRRFNKGNPDKIVSGDASSTGYGGGHMDMATMLPDRTKRTYQCLMPNHCQGVKLRGGHSTKTEPFCGWDLVYKMSIDEDWWNLHVMYLGDNLCHKSYTNKEGGKKKPILKIQLHYLSHFRKRGITLTQGFKDGLTMIAWGWDGDGRTGLMWTMAECTIRKHMYLRIIRHLQVTIDMDACASSENAVVPSFISRYPEIGNHSSDILTCPLTSLDNLTLWCFPPVKLINQILERARHLPSGTVLVMTVPMWERTTWFSTLLDLLTSIPILFPCNQRHLAHPLRPPREWTKGWHMVSCTLSASSTARLEFRSRLHALWSTTGHQGLTKSILSSSPRSSTTAAKAELLSAALTTRLFQSS